MVRVTEYAGDLFNIHTKSCVRCVFLCFPLPQCRIQPYNRSINQIINAPTFDWFYYGFRCNFNFLLGFLAVTARPHYLPFFLSFHVRARTRSLISQSLVVPVHNNDNGFRTPRQLVVGQITNAIDMTSNSLYTTFGWDNQPFNLQKFLQIITKKRRASPRSLSCDKRHARLVSN